MEKDDDPRGLPVSPRVHRLLALERGDASSSDASPHETSHTASRRLLLRSPASDTHVQERSSSSTSDRSRRTRRRTSDPTGKERDAHASSPWTELIGTASPSTLLRLLAALLAVLFVFDLTVESLAVAYCTRPSAHRAMSDPQATHEATTSSGWFSSLFFRARHDPAPTHNEADDPFETSSCSPGVVDLTATFHASRSRHRFYDLLVKLGTPTPPVFTREFQVLCEAGVRHQSRFGYCLPIGGRTDEPFCARADRMDLLVPTVNATGFCYASVLHLLFVEAYEELEALGAKPLVAYGSLLGAVRNGSMISYTEDADIAYEPLPPDDLELFKARLWRKGFHVFYFSRLWRLCVAPTHPLASVLFTPDKGLTRNYKVPYVDLYEMRPVEFADGIDWDLFGTRDDRLLPDNRVRPFSTVEINGVAFNTFADPVDFLVDEYGKDFMTPVEREPKKINGFNFQEAFLEETEAKSKKKKTNTAGDDATETSNQDP